MISNSSKIINIESNSQHLNIDFRFTNCYGYGGWLGINPKCFIRPTGSNLQYALVAAYLIYAPSFFQQGDETLRAIKIISLKMSSQHLLLASQKLV
jgi:hypothetical protein